MRTIAGILITFLVMTVANPHASQPCQTSPMAVTLLETSWQPGDLQFHKTGLVMPITKHRADTALLYTCQITFQNNTTAPLGIKFKMRVRDEAGNYIMPDMQTASVTEYAFVSYNAAMTDTVYHAAFASDPPAGNYTFELWALAGGGQFLIVPYMSNLVVFELPRYNCQEN